MAEMNESIAIARYYLTEMFGGQGDLSRLYDLFTSDAVSYGLDRQPVYGPEGQRQFIELLRGAFRDLQVTVEGTVANEAQVAVRFTVRGVHQGRLRDLASTGLLIVVPGNAIYRITGGKITESWTTFDVLGISLGVGLVQVLERFLDVAQQVEGGEEEDYFYRPRPS